MRKHFGIITGILGVVLTVIGIVFKHKKDMSVGIIGGPDGPTSIYITGGNIFVGFIIIGIVLMILAGVIMYKRKF